MADGGWRKALILKSFLGGLRTGLSKKPQKSAKIFPFVNKGQEKGRKDFLDLFAESKRRKFMVNKQFLSFK